MLLLSGKVRDVLAAFQQQPLWFARFLAGTHAHQGPFTTELLAFEEQVQFAFAQGANGIVSTDLIRTGVPDHDRSSTVIALGNSAFEVSVIERMVLDLHRESAVALARGEPFGNSPGL